MNNTLKSLALTVLMLLCNTKNSFARQFTKITSGDLVNLSSTALGHAWGDYDSDGDQDLLILNDNENNYLYNNDLVNGRFVKIDTGAIINRSSLGAAAHAASWADYDNDGDLDVVVLADLIYLYTNENGKGHFSEISLGNNNLVRGVTCSWMDFDNDNDLDLFIIASNLNSQSFNKVYRNDGNAVFNETSLFPITSETTPTYSSSWADYDNDGDLDLFISNTIGNSTVYQNNGNGVFSEVSSGGVLLINNEGSNTSSWADYNNDGYIDLHTTKGDEISSVIFKNEQNSNFSKVELTEFVEGNNSIGSSWGDYDNDGDLDLLVSNLKIVLYKNQGNSEFSPVIIENNEGNYGSCSWVDYDNDGDLDLFATNYNGGKNVLYRNEGNEFGWINISLKGTVSNGSAIGAKVSIKNNAEWQYRTLTTTSGYSSQNSLNVEFGLGVVSNINTLIIDWPSGLIEEFEDVSINQHITITENQISNPLNLNVLVVSGTSLYVYWQDNVLRETQYIIERSLNENTDFEEIATVEKNTPQFVDLDLTYDSIYYYRVKAINESQSSDYSNIASGRTNDRPVVQEVIKNASEGAIVFYNDSDFIDQFSDLNEEDNLTHIIIKSLPEDGALFLNSNQVILNQVIEAVDIPFLNFSASQNWNGTTKFFYNGSDGKNYSEKTARCIINLAAVNDSPEFSYPLEIVLVEDFSGEELVDVIPGEIPPDEIDQTVFYFPNLIESDLATIVVDEETGRIIISSKENQYGSQEITVYANDGQSENNIDSASIVLTILNVPEPPKNFSAIAVTDNRIDLSWDDNSDEESYIIERSNHPDSAFIKLDSLSMNTTAFSDASLKDSTTYYYKIRAKIDERVSEYSNANATTLIKLVFTNNFSDEFSLPQQIGGALLNVKQEPDDVAFVIFHSVGISDNTITYDSTLLHNSTGDYAVAFNNFYFDDVGISFYFEIHTTDGQVIVTNPALCVIYYSNGLDMEGLKFGNDVNSYQIISVPLGLNNKSISSVFEDDLGEYDIKNWRLFRYQNETNVEYMDLTNSPILDTIEPGKGYWLITKNEVNINTGPGETIGEPSIIDLEKGWNQIGNPYNFNIYWPDVKDYNNTQIFIGDLIEFEDGFHETQILKKNRGAFIFTTVPLQLEIPLTKNLTFNPKKKEFFKSNPIDEDNWEVRFKLENHLLEYNLGGLGMHPEAIKSKDQYDDMTPPSLGQFLELNFNHPEYFVPKFTKDIITTQENFIWDFEINSSEKGFNLLSWNNNDFGVNNLNLFLLDVEKQKIVDMKERGEYQYINKNQRSRFKVYFGDNDFIEKELIPERMTVGDLYPNPISESFTIPVTLPTDLNNYQLEALIYDLKGKQLDVLKHKNLKAGFHNVVWNLKAPNTTRLKKGLYILNVKIKSDNKIKSFSKKLIIK